MGGFDSGAVFASAAIPVAYTFCWQMAELFAVIQTKACDVITGMCSQRREKEEDEIREIYESKVLSVQLFSSTRIV